MKRNCLLVTAGLAALSASAQPLQRRADITGGGSRDQGKCTIEVVVDGAAEVQIQGDHATIRNIDGQTPQWRRFVCNEPMPPNPAGFRFAGVPRVARGFDRRLGGVIFLRRDGLLLNQVLRAVVIRGGFLSGGFIRSVHFMLSRNSTTSLVACSVSPMNTGLGILTLS